MASSSRAAPLDLRSRNVPPPVITDVTDQAGDDESNPPHTPNSQPEGQEGTQGTGANSSHTVGGNDDQGNNAPRDPTPQVADPRLEGMTAIQRFRLMELEAERLLNVEKLKLAQMENARGHRREHSDDHYRDASRKKASVTKAPEKQPLDHYNSVVMFLQDCEDYIASAPRNDFQTDAEKVRWGSAILADAKKQTWRNQRDATLHVTGEPTWENFKAWCLNQVRNPVVKSHEVGRQLAKASMRENQTVANFNDYLASLWAQKDREVTDAERMEALRDRVIEKIPLEAMKEAIQPTTYAALLQQYQSIEQRLRRTKDLPTLDKTRSGDNTTTQGGGSQQGKAKGQPAKNTNKGATVAATQGGKPKRNKSKDGDRKPSKDDVPAKLTCWKCGNPGHYKGSRECPQYEEGDETRKQSSSKGKGKA